ncbi:MAG: glycosyltransferase family 4 protein [Candidatus Omnitrophota bacterium]
MNILILANHFNPGGISSYILNLAQGLTVRGHKVYIGSAGGEWVERLTKNNIEHINLPLKTKSIISPKLLFSYFILKKALKDKRVDIIHSQTRVTSVLAYWLSAKTAIPFVSTAHGFFKPRWERLRFPCWGDLVIAISHAVKEHLIRDFKVAPDKIRLVRNGIKVASLQSPVSRRKEIKEEFGLKDGPVVGIIARLSEVKGHKYLIQAMSEVAAEIPEVQLLSVGDGAIKKELEDLALSLGILERARFIPAVADTREALSVMDVFVMPSLQEGLGLSIMEAMLSGLAVAASSVGGIPSLIKDGQTGILVRPKDASALAKAIISLLKDNKKAFELGENARELIVKEFSLERMIHETEEVYRLCLRR